MNTMHDGSQDNTQLPSYPYSYPTGNTAVEQHYPQQSETNTMSVIGFLVSLFMPVLGLILSIIGLVQIKRSGERGRGFAIAGIIISGLWCVFVIAFLALGGLALLSNKDATSYADSPANSQNYDYSDEQSSILTTTPAAPVDSVSSAGRAENAPERGDGTDLARYAGAAEPEACVYLLGGSQQRESSVPQLAPLLRDPEKRQIAQGYSDMLQDPNVDPATTLESTRRYLELINQISADCTEHMQS
ncbi:DUF4190 domain-containing protein [Corynebacterium sp. sy017]|uniref:DUF4190 domain-containing protein n=1 Tax=unclassified Corynebacterium TaxID=2624378 RepID=UPI0011848B31|nr:MULTISPECIES: DUF4190 domain-containing protein [unclassified Corynebacterium]MBP3087892.1 DUF4190 domain-containing protein [Corynebacterium sp. sy017]TSD92433.1 DUF4190 domain-containing protein [Corynebacterium sp. SY003]